MVFVAGCIQDQTPTPTPTLQPLQPSTLNQSPVDRVVNASNQFALDLYSEYEEGDGNIFFSPYSVSSALAMAYEGARGETAEEIQSVFHFPEDNVRRGGFKSLYQEINDTGRSDNYTIHTANALWAQKDYEFLDSYFNIVKRYYGGEVTNLDFSKPEASRERINSWVEEQTNDKIEDLLPAGSINPMTRLMLTNAVYFKGDWLKQFNKTETEEREFHTGNNTVEVPMMHCRAELNYTETKNTQILELPYTGKEISMLVLLPKENLETLEDSLTTQNLSKWRQDLVNRKVNVYLPRFELETKYFMKNTLKEMGMRTAFSSKADFSGMTGNQDLFIDQVIHQAYVKVNEEGTEAAAATAVILRSTSTKPQETPTFKADHPFIFIIQQKETGNILFIGRLTNP